MRLLKDLRESLREPGFWTYGVWLDIISKNRRNRFGPLWLFAPTAILVLVLGKVYSQLMNHPLHDYLPYLGVGYAHWRLMTQAISQSSDAFASYRSFIMDGRVRLTDYLLRMLARSLFHYGAAMLVIVCVLVWSPAVKLSGMLSLALTLPVFLLNAFWISTVLGLLGARFPDTREVVGAVMTFGFLLTPILWYASKFTESSTRGHFVRLNPFYHLIDFVRAPVIGHPMATDTWIYVAVMTVGGWLLAALLYRRYGRFVPLWI